MCTYFGRLDLYREINGRGIHPGQFRSAFEGHFPVEPPIFSIVQRGKIVTRQGLRVPDFIT